MAKTIYITEEVAKQLSELSKPLTDLPSDIKNVLRNHKTSLGQHPSFPPEEEVPFDMMITQSRFDEARTHLLDFNLQDYSTKSLQKHLQDLVNKCKDIENNFKEKLENICYNYIIE